MAGGKELPLDAVFEMKMRQLLILPFVWLISCTTSAADPEPIFAPPPVCGTQTKAAPPAEDEAPTAQPKNGAENDEPSRPPPSPRPAGLADYAIRALNGGGFEVRAAIDIAAPRTLVRETLTDCGEAFRYMPGLRLCKVLDNGPDFDVTRHKIKRYWLLPGADFIFRAQYHLPDRIDVELVEGNLRRLEARWSFCALDEAATRLVYQASIEAGWYVPRRSERRALKRDLPEMLRRMKAQSEARRAMLAAPPDETSHRVDTIDKTSNRL